MKTGTMSGRLVAIALGVIAPGGAAWAADNAPPAQPPAAMADMTGAPVYDPWEPMNRGLFRISRAIDDTVVRPLALGYMWVTPSPIRKGVTNAFNNLGEPVTFINDVLQLRPAQAGRTTARFFVNSTVGMLGLMDVAGGSGIPIHYSDFGQTLGRYGVGPGPFIYLPVFGPSDVRDGVGRIADAASSPLNIHDFHISVGARLGIALANGISTRANIDDQLEALRHTATDEYAAQRSIFLQNRQSVISEPKAALQQLPDFDAPATAAPPAHNP